MSTHKKIDIICMAAVFFAIAVTAALVIGGSIGMLPVVSAQTGSDFFTANDLKADWDISSATKITLSDKGSTIKGNGAYTHEGDVYIVYAGHYVLTGELTDGSVIIDADKNDKIWISLDGVTIHCGDDSAIRVEQADKVFLTLAEGTENIISSGSQYNEEVIASGVDGTIYSRDDLTINGTGALVVNADYKHGIVCNDDLAVTGGRITIDALQDGIHANDSVRIREAGISITAGDDGITVSNDDETAFLYVESGNISISDCYEGLEAIEITIAGGNIDIRAADDGINANGSGAGSVIRITGGDISIINSSGRDADGLDSNGSIYVEGGRVFISVADSGGNSALDYGSENGGECVISGGTVIACGSSSMAEGFASDSPQGFLMYNGTSEAGTTISLEDSLGAELLSEEIPCGFSSVVISVPGLKVGDVCTLKIGEEQEQITIDNTSASGSRSAGMFGGGMHNGSGRGEKPTGLEDRDNQEEQGGQPGDSEFPGGPGRPEETDLPEGMGQPGGQGMPEGMEPPGDVEFPEGMEPPGDMGFPEGMEPPGDMGFPEGTEDPGRTDLPDGAEPLDGREFQEAGGRAFGAGQEQRSGDRSGQQSRGGMYSGEGLSDSGFPADTMALLGASALVLLIGLGIAVKIRH